MSILLLSWLNSPYTNENDCTPNDSLETF
jgi:hypothetical protein